MYESVCLSQSYDIINDSLKKEPIEHKLNELISFMLYVYDDETSLESFRHALSFHELNIKFLEKSERCTIPLIIMRELLVNYKIKFNRKKVASFTDFCSKYGKLILEINNNKFTYHQFSSQNHFPQHN